MRGEVYLCDVLFPGDVEPRKKYAVLLQDREKFPNIDQLSVVVGSTLKPTHKVGPYHVIVGAAQGFKVDTIIDCRWVFTLSKTDVTTGPYLTQLDPLVMQEIAVALVHGLQL
jgi:mRNA-degrading endonuclease toxin of MazEF toxin-antitoxin module